MNDNAIAFSEGVDLLNKLFSEQTPLFALLISPTGTRIRIAGRLDSLTREVGMVILSARPPSATSASIRIQVFDRTCEFSFGDANLLPESRREELAATFGDSFLCLDFSSELLILFFNSLKNSN
jgi:hypothetical protein